MKWTNRVGRWLGCGTTLTILAAGGAGCLSRPVGTGAPTTKVNFTAGVAQSQIDKIDLLFAIDNSASMKDKQDILKEAVPDLLDGLLNPLCEDAVTKQPTTTKADVTKASDNYGCPANTQPAFKPITDMHIAIVSSSIGTPGSNTCNNAPGQDQNDQGHLIQRGLPGGADFLAWYPTAGDVNSDKDRHPAPPNSASVAADFNTLKNAFAANVTGTNQIGCGIEGQLESVYHFLVQPDPWKEVAITNGNADVGSGNNNIDVDLLKQRADFLRPDSLVAVVMLSDEDDSWADPLSLGGRGYTFMSTAPSFKPTSVCSSDLNSADCTSCGYANSNPKVAADSNCAGGGKYAAPDDQLNARMVRMKERFGIDPQYPIQRYVDGFSAPQVPDRSTEHNGTGPYVGTPKCTNPLFASKLPNGSGDYCNLERGSRSPGLVFFANIGGAPNQLIDALTGADANDPNAVSDAWTKIIGKDPEHYDYSGQSVYMVQSLTPRSGLPGNAALGDNGSDPVVGRDWDTKKGDLQFACTFPLPTPRPPNPQDPGDCNAQNGGTPPLCQADGTQIRAKAYPTVRQFQVVHKLGKQGIAASLCPKQLTDPSKDDYGYKPAVKGILDRLKAALTQQCLPQQLQRDTADNTVPCLVLAKLADKGKKCKDVGLTDPPTDVVATFRDQERAAKRDATLPVCTVPQKAVAKGDTCKLDQSPVWCYVENSGSSAPAGTCPQALAFSAGTTSLGATTTFSLQCIQQFSSGGTSSGGDAGQ